jgi:hypothetical protein
LVDPSTFGASARFFSVAFVDHFPVDVEVVSVFTVVWVSEESRLSQFFHHYVLFVRCVLAEAYGAEGFVFFRVD